MIIPMVSLYNHILAGIPVMNVRFTQCHKPSHPSITGIIPSHGGFHSAHPCDGAWSMVSTCVKFAPQRFSKNENWLPMEDIMACLMGKSLVFHG